MKSFYIAGRVANAPLIRELASRLEKLGFTWSYNWTDHEPIAKPISVSDRQIGAFAQSCIDGIAKSDLFILVAKDSLGARGFYIELGIALANRVPVWIIGDENPSVFSCLPQVRHAIDFDELLKNIEEKK